MKCNDVCREPAVAPFRYELVGLIEHRGGLHGGHYTSYIRNIADANQWFHVSDDKLIAVRVGWLMCRM